MCAFFPQVEVTKFGIDKKNMFAFWDVSNSDDWMYTLQNIVKFTSM